jgi:sugar lactone lactonase YvrE
MPPVVRNATVIADRLTFTEAPRWHAGRLWFSDFYDAAVKSCTAAGDVRTEFTIDDRPSGLGWLPDDRMLIVAMQQRQVLVRALDGSISPYADLSQIATFHCNDMVVDAAGRAYVGNFGFDLDHAFESRGVAETFADHPTAALIRVDLDGSVIRAAEGLHFPNGAVLTPDETTLIVAETLAGRLTAFDVASDGSLSNRRVWAELDGVAPDGICLDAQGQVWVANAVAAQCVLVQEGGEVVDSVTTSQTAFACMLGGDRGTTLFCCTAADSNAKTAGVARSAAIEIAEVDIPRAGRP